MNFALMISCKVEDKLAEIEHDDSWTQAKEAQAYEQCLKDVLEADGRAWADGNIRVGDYILLSKLPFSRHPLDNNFSNRSIQLIPILVYRLIAYLMLRRKWSALPKSELCSFLPALCKLFTTTLKTESHSSPT